MHLFTRAQYEQLLRNGEKPGHSHDPFPVVKLMLERANCAWLLTELDPQDGLMAYGLCDLGLGSPEMGYFDLGELARLKLPADARLEVDPHFTAQYPVSIYARAARAHGLMIEDNAILQHYQAVPHKPAFQLG